MRVRASFPAGVAASLAAAALVVACGLDMGGLDTGPGDGGSSSSSGSSSGTTSGSGASSGSSTGSSSGSGGSSSGASSGSGSSSGASSGSSGLDATAGDAPSGADSTAPQDSSTGLDVVVVDTGPTCTTANGCYTIPAGWQPVAMATSQSSACPSGWANAAPVDVVEGPNTSQACQCAACAITQQPSCEAGAIGVKFDVQGQIGAGQCGAPGQPAQMNQTPNGPGGCDTDMYKGGNGGITPSYKNIDLQFTAPTTVTPGKCTSTGVATNNITYASQDRACVPDSQASAGCTGNQCTPTVPAPYKFCISQSGSHACPGGANPFTVQHVVGTSVTLTCSACGCSVTSGGCMGGTVRLFTDDKCTKGEIDVLADGQCHDPNAQSDTYGSYIYAANDPTGVACQSSGSSTAQNVTLASQETFCCLP